MTVSRETIEGVYSFPWDVDIKFVDACTWIGAYTNGYRKPHYPMPALIQDSQSDLAKRWSGWFDDDRLSGHKY